MSQQTSNTSISTQTISSKSEEESKFEAYKNPQSRMEPVSHVVDQDLKDNKAKLEWIITKIINPIIFAI